MINVSSYPLSTQGMLQKSPDILKNKKKQKNTVLTIKYKRQILHSFFALNYNLLFYKGKHIQNTMYKH